MPPGSSRLSGPVRVAPPLSLVPERCSGTCPAPSVELSRGITRSPVLSCTACAGHLARRSLVPESFRGGCSFGAVAGRFPDQQQSLTTSHDYVLERSGRSFGVRECNGRSPNPSNPVQTGDVAEGRIARAHNAAFRWVGRGCRAGRTNREIASVWPNWHGNFELTA